MDVRQVRPAEVGARLGVRLLAVGMMVLCLDVGPASAVLKGEGSPGPGPGAVRLAAAKPTEPEETRFPAADVLPWKPTLRRASFIM